MVGLPGAENREMIFRTVLSKEIVEEDLDFKELATMTEGYTGSDLKVCVLNSSLFGFNGKLALLLMTLLCETEFMHNSCLQAS